MTDDQERPIITQEMIKAYDDYTHLSLDRRGFMSTLSQLAGGSAAAAAILPLIQANAAQAALVAADDPRLAVAEVSWPGEGGDVRGYLARPSQPGERFPALIVIHENRGLNDHIRDVTRRAALEGYVALAPDLLSPSGGTPADEDVARELIGALEPAVTIANLRAAATFLRDRPDSTGAVGAMGFCWGGGMVLRLAIADPDLRAAVSYYGGQPAAADVPAIKAHLLLHYAGLDDRINAGIPAFQKALDEAGVPYEIFTYDGVNHAFNNDTSAARYDKAAADLAWSRTFAFFKQTLDGAT